MTPRDTGHPRTVIYLGAGASVAEGAPAQADLFREYFKSCRQRIERILDEQMDTDLAAYFQDYWGIDVLTFPPKAVPVVIRVPALIFPKGFCKFCSG